jgi:hypothetical protein
VTNLFANLIFDGVTGDRVRYFCINTPGRAKPWRTLKSDAKRLNPKAKVVGWLYSHFEAAFLKFITELDWKQVNQSKENTLLLEKRQEITVLQGKIEEIDQRLERFAEAIASSEEKPTFLVRKIAETEAEQKALESRLVEATKSMRKLERDEENLRHDEDRIRKLIEEQSEEASLETRLLLREEIRRKVKRITIYPEPAGSAKKPSFMVEFVNGYTTWVRTSPVAIGAKATQRNENPEVIGIRFQPSDEAPDPLEDLNFDPEERGSE